MDPAPGRGAGGPPGIQMVPGMQCLWELLGHGAVCSGTDSAPRRAPTEERGRGVLRGKDPKAEILAQHTN